MEGKKGNGQVAHIRAHSGFCVTSLLGTGGEPRLTGCQELGRALCGFVGNFPAHGNGVCMVLAQKRNLPNTAIGSQGLARSQRPASWLWVNRLMRGPGVSDGPGAGGRILLISPAETGAFPLLDPGERVMPHIHLQINVHVPGRTVK